MDKIEHNFTLKELTFFRTRRINVTNFIYQFVLFDEKINKDLAYESGTLNNSEVEYVEKISDNFDKIFLLIKSSLDSNWGYNRIPAYIKSVLIVATYEFFKLDSAVVINEFVVITKEFAPDMKLVGFVNSVLEKIGVKVNEIKNKRIKK